jgi:hypothetical protein
VGVLTRRRRQTRRLAWHRAARGGLALSLALSLALLAVAFAAPGTALADDTVFRGRSFSDVPRNQASYFDVVAAVGLLRGDGGPGGACRPSEPVTRAELAVMAQRLLALDPEFVPPEATALAFSDASTIPDWAASAVAACQAMGLISGEPDGAGGLEFNPWDTVSGAEAVAIFLRALGNESNIAGGWPSGYIFRAYETGLLSSDVESGDWRMLGPLTPLTRAQVAYVLHNAFFCSRAYRAGSGGREGTFARPSIAASLTGTSLLLDVDLAGHAVTVADGGGRTLRLAETVVAPGVAGKDNLIGYRVFWLENGQGAVAYLLPYGREEAVTGTLAELRLNSDGKRVLAIALEGGRVVACASGVIVELNGRRWPFDPGIILPTAQVSLVTSQGQAVYVTILQENLPEAVVKTLSIVPQDPAEAAAGARPTGRIIARISMGEGDIPLLVTAETAVYLDGKPADLADLRERDVFYAATEGSVPNRVLRLYAYRNRVTGTVEDVVRHYDLAGLYWILKVRDLSGTEVSLPVSQYCDDRVSAALGGQKLTFCLNRLGEVTFFGPPAPLPLEPRVVKVLRETVAGGHHLLTVDWQGSELTYKLPPELAAPPMGALARMAAGAEGAVTSLAPPSPARFDATVVYVDLQANRLTLTRDGINWKLDMATVGIYAATGADANALVGNALPLSALQPGQLVWLDEPAAPGYLLLVP